MRSKISDTKQTWREFGWVLGLMVGLAGVLWARKRADFAEVATPSLIAGGLIVILATLHPPLFRLPFKWAGRFGEWAGGVMGKVLLSVVFWTLVLPLGWVLRRTGKDLLETRRRPQTSSYWKPAKPHSPLDRLF